MDACTRFEQTRPARRQAVSSGNNLISHLDKKLWRDLRRMAGQAVAVALVMACGLAMMIMARSLIYSLESTRREFYEANRFAEIFAHLKRAPNSIAARAAEIPGVAA